MSDRTTLLAQRLAAVRAQTLALAAPLSEADCQVQSMPDASPVKWHLAHTTWFFETFVLERFEPGFRPWHPAFRVLFNSYYQGVGDQHPRPQRGLVTRPALAEVKAWRASVDERLQALLAAPPPGQGDAIAALVELGLQHEQQHQELILTDLLHLLSCNPLAPAYADAPPPAVHDAAPPGGWTRVDGGVVEIGHAGAGFAFDNETPRHRVYLRPCALADDLVTQGDWRAFMADGGYDDARWWLAAGWDWRQAQGIAAPLYWRRDGEGGWCRFTLRGLQPLDERAPVVHVSAYEADAYARWHGAQHGAPHRLPTEAEWEQAAQRAGTAAIDRARGVDDGALLPLPPSATLPAGPRQLFGEVWQWTASAYQAYPGFRPAEGAIGQYNAKFMVNQLVLRGGSCATPRSHLRASYRNFFPPEARWQFSGLRLARDLD